MGRGGRYVDSSDTTGHEVKGRDVGDWRMGQSDELEAGLVGPRVPV